MKFKPLSYIIAAMLLFWSSILLALGPPAVSSLSQTLQEIDTHLQASSQQPEFIDILVQQLKDDDAKIQAEFTQIENHLRNQNLPAVIIQRHARAVWHYRRDMANLQEQLVAVAEGNSSAKSKTQQALQPTFRR